MANLAFRGLDADDRLLGDQYAALQACTDPNTGKRVTFQPLPLFVTCATRFLQANPEGTIPATPPTQPFAGDTIALTATAGTGEITFTASGPNASGVTTELLLQQFDGGDLRSGWLLRGRVLGRGGRDRLVGGASDRPHGRGDGRPRCVAQGGVNGAPQSRRRINE